MKKLVLEQILRGFNIFLSQGILVVAKMDYDFHCIQ